MSIKIWAMLKKTKIFNNKIKLFLQKIIITVRNNFLSLIKILMIIKFQIAEKNKAIKTDNHLFAQQILKSMIISQMNMNL